MTPELKKAADEAFKAWMDWDDRQRIQPFVQYQGQQLPICRIFGLIWNCTDYYDSFEHGNDLADIVYFRGGNPEGRQTYAKFAREIYRLMISQEYPAWPLGTIER